jgi:hypothetical protein
MLGAMVLIGSIVQQKLEVKLVDTPPVTKIGSAVVLQSPFSIGGVIVPNGFGLDLAGNRLGATFVYSVPASATAFRAVFGVQDSEGYLPSGTLNVYVDGEVFKEYRATGGQKPIKVEVPLLRASSMKFVFDGPGSLGNPIYSNLPAPIASTPKPTVSALQTGELPRVNMLSPENGEKARDKVVFKWERIDDAVAYGVEIVLISNATSKVPTRFLRAFTATKESFEWNFSDDVVSGDYQVSVIAFNKKGICSKFSSFRKFTVVRK